MLIKNKILKNNSAIVTLKNHLSSEISLDIDFAYVFKTNTLKDINFNEELKIYEGLTYYKIYQKYGNQFYSKNVICKRDRTRKDSVSKDYILTSNIQLNVALKYLTLIIYNHRSDFIKYGLRKQLSKISFKVAIIKIMLNNKNGLETINLSFFLKLLLNLLSIFNAGKLLKFFYFLYKKQQNNDTI